MHRKAIPTPPLTSILIHPSAVEDLYRLRSLTRAKRAARHIAARNKETYGNSLSVPNRLRSVPRAEPLSFSCLGNCQNNADALTVPYRLCRFTRAEPCTLSRLTNYQNNRDALPVLYRLRRLTRAKRAAGLIAALHNETDGNSLPVPFRLRRFTRAGFWYAMHVSTARGHRSNREILIYGPAIRIRRNHLKTIIGDQLRSTVQGVDNFAKATELRRLARADVCCAIHVSTARGHRFSHEILINGPAIRIPRNHLKTIIGDHLRSTVKGGAQNHRSESKSNRTQGSP